MHIRLVPNPAAKKAADARPSWSKEQLRALLKPVTTKTALKRAEKAGTYFHYRTLVAYGAGGISRTRSSGTSIAWEDIVSGARPE